MEKFYKQYIKGGSIPKRGSTNSGHDEDLYIRLRRKTEYGVAVRFAILVRPHADNFYSAIYMWHYFNGYSQLTSMNDRLLITPDIVKVVGKYGRSFNAVKQISKPKEKKYKYILLFQNASM